jgi:hypothetical protein
MRSLCDVDCCWIPGLLHYEVNDVLLCADRSKSTDSYFLRLREVRD